MVHPATHSLLRLAPELKHWSKSSLLLLSVSGLEIDIDLSAWSDWGHRRRSRNRVALSRGLVVLVCAVGNAKVWWPPRRGSQHYQRALDRAERLQKRSRQDWQRI